MKKIIVIGASAASIAFIAKLRSFDLLSQVICFSGEASIPYNRCFLADFLIDEQAEQQLQLKPQDFFEKNNVDLRLNSWVTKIDTVGKKVLVADVWYEYEYLFLGMGTRPVVPKFMQNLKMDGLFHFHTLADVQNIKNFVHKQQPKTALVIGAGLNGIEAASSLVDLKISVTMVEAAATILPGQVDQEIVLWISDRMLQAGVSVITGCKVVGLDQKNGHTFLVVLDNDQIISTDMVIVAAGSQVNSNILYDTGIALCDSSVLANHQLKTNLEGVFAGGDLCMVPDMITGKLVRSTTWSDAMLQGLCAAMNLSSTPRSYPGMQGLRDSYFFGMEFYGCGMTVGHTADVVEVVVKIDGKNVKKFYLQNGQLIGFVLIGDISRLSEYKMWYVTRKNVEKSNF